MFVTGNTFLPSLIFVGKARNLPYSGELERGFSGVGSRTTLKLAVQERLATDKHSSLIRTIINYGCKMFNYIGLGPK